LSPFAHEGATVIDGHKDGGARMTLKGRALRGIFNKSMVCSEKELGISDEHEGIMLLDWDEFGHLPPGTPFQDVLGDAVLDIDILPNIARAYSILGVAREIAALFGKELRYPSFDVQMAGATIEGTVELDIRAPELNPRFTFTLIRDVEMRPAPQWMQRRLKLVGQRPINNIVDITNYVMFELGQPLHAYDYDVLVQRAGGNAPLIITRLPDAGEKHTTLDGVEHDLDDFNIMVADGVDALGFGGIMGGLESEIWDPVTMGDPLDALGIEVADDDELTRGKASVQRPATTNVLLEAAAWNFINIRRSMQSQKMNTEAGMRFSRGVHPEMALRGCFRGIELMRQTSGGVVAAGHIDAYPLPAETPVIDLPLSEVDRALGFELAADEIIDILRRLEFEVEVVEDGLLRVTAPDHRTDIGVGLTGVADLIEEIARIHGYDNVPNTVIDDMLPKQRANPSLEREEALRDALARVGLREIVNYRLTTPEAEARLTPEGAASDWPDYPYVTLANPIAADKAVLRHTLLSEMLDIAAENARHADRQLLFEIGHVYLPADGQLLPDEPGRVGIVMLGYRGVPQWTGASMPGVFDFFDLKGVIETVLRDLRIAGTPTFTPTEHNTFHPGRVATLSIDGRAIGVLGQVHPLVCDRFGIGDRDTPVLAAELDLDALLADVVQVRDITPVPTQPAVYEDIALVMDTSIAAAEVEAVIRAAGGALLEDVRLFDVYTGDSVEAGKKSLAYALTYRARDKTLTEKTVKGLRNKIIKTVKKKLGAELRA
ncbi:MAG: phenylalanine--tRNA ligase subunit beta, partial [Anaerolineae bacterium]|nr:phenylalanine--tRNA ligase subunit beta [Anaerolineae bacterium]